MLLGALALIECYSHFTAISEAVALFKAMPDPVRRTTTFNAMMRGYINIKSYGDALALYHDRLEDVSLSPPRRRDDVSHLLASIALVGLDDLETALEYLERSRCFHHPRPLDVHRMLAVLSLMTTFPVDIYPVPTAFMVNAVSKCGSNAALLGRVHAQCRRLCVDEVVGVRDQMVVNTALIDSYGACKRVGDALVVFEGIADGIKDAVCVGAMMKVLLQNGKYREVLALYDRYSSQRDDVSHLLALQACSELEDLEKGQAIRHSLPDTPMCVTLSLCEQSLEDAT